MILVLMLSNAGAYGDNYFLSQPLVLLSMPTTTKLVSFLGGERIITPIRSLLQEGLNYIHVLSKHNTFQRIAGIFSVKNLN